ncbi:MAG: hypothetical protein HY201_02420 [Nitrospirae bacterium]|nr:hypothetical protein [Nitrospirota bacterium]MBI3358609.1 hypothetical protein [Candidatus Troglogloeales bacterium]MBI3598299.1 hypothetical protein [Candidatus Troglogloeales bacterium]
MKYIKQLAIFLVVLLPMGANAAALSENGTGNVDDIAKALVTYFPKVTGKVTSVNQETVMIQAENATGLSEGVLLSAYREGEVFYHPVTDVALGHFEEETALLEVTKVERGQITARAISTQTPVIENLVRLTAARIPIGISSGVVEGDRYLLNELKLALEATGRFAVTVLPPLATFEDVAREGNLYLITFTANPSPISVKVVMQNVKTGKIVSDMESVLQASNESDTILESLQYQLFEKQQKGIAVK